MAAMARDTDASAGPRREPIPWWTYLVAASFAGYLAFITYLDVAGPSIGLSFSFRDGLGVTDVLPNSPAVDGGFEKGDLIVAIDGHAIKTSSDWNAVRLNFE